MQLGEISGDTTLYLIRHALVSTFMEATEQAQVTRLSDLPEHLFPAVVTLYVERRQLELQMEEERKERVQKELAAYYTGRVAARGHKVRLKSRKEEQKEEQQFQAALLEDASAPDRETSAAALYSSEKALLTALTVWDLYACLYILEQQASSAWHCQRFKKFVTLKAIYEAEKRQDLITEKTRLLALREVLQRVLATGKTLRLTYSKMLELNEQCQSLEQHIYYVRVYRIQQT
eukprot:Gregarina_sp_Poly_1__8800@NODE_528_length_7666_cov_26_468351_g418_i0_p3_GENE_NODE_528_length_7666_cov_26_468351_g418_i0NODE_528_length_7666_cov_26_468351_g418_i0_p3_ORF_typecomplete_len233_score39_25Wax2_C/PF12076_8/0_15Efg1/PF10153_9/0_23Efg1/PF10153_9/1_9e02_NODE_528_length_7666_cov_26_468351_g418_i048095507